MKISLQRLVLILTITILGVACGVQPETPTPIAGVSGPLVTISSPAPNQTFVLGQPIQVQSTAVDPLGVIRIELLIDQKLVRTEANPNPLPNMPFITVQQWRPTTPGSYIIQVWAYNIDQTLGQSEKLLIHVEESESSIGLVEPITPTPLGTTSISESEESAEPSPTATATPIGMQETPQPLCTPPLCNEGEVYYCPDECPGGCGTQCATPTAEAQAPNPTSSSGLPASASDTIAPVPEVIIDNQDPPPAFTTSGPWYIGDGGHSYREDCHWTPRGMGNNARFTPVLPRSGTYEVLAWWCGDPNHDQTNRAIFSIWPTGATPDVYTVEVNLQEQAGQWNSLGHYYFDIQDKGFVNINGGYNGNVIADAVKFVYVGSQKETVPPTPLPQPTSIITHNPPTPLQQVTAGDLTIRLNLVGNNFYNYTPLVSTESVTFDDCLHFPGPGCNGSRPGWRVKVQYVDQSGTLEASYRVSQDYSLVFLESTEQVAPRQRNFLTGQFTAIEGTSTRFQIDRYPPPDHSWHFFAHKGDKKLDIPLSTENFEPLEHLIEQYNTVRITTDSWEGVLYGLGTQSRLTAEDQAQLETFGDRLSKIVP